MVYRFSYVDSLWHLFSFIRSLRMRGWFVNGNCAEYSDVVENCYLNWNIVTYSLLHITSCKGSAGCVEMGDVRF